MTFPSRFSPVSARSVEVALLLGLAFFIPLLEAPKNVFWFAFALLWVFNRMRSGAWGGRWDRWDTLIAAWIGSGFIVAAFANIGHDEWGGAFDLVRTVGLLWLVRRGGYTARELVWLGGALLAGCAVGLLWAYWAYLVRHTRPYLELHSVGHVNQSAIYVAICCALALSWLLARWHVWNWTRRTGMLLLFAHLALGLLVTQSRGAIGAFLFVPFALGIGWWRRSRLPLIALSIGAIAVVLVAVIAGVGVVKKQSEYMARGDYLSHRDTIWRRALIGWETRPWFGFGIGNFNRIDDEIVRRQVAAKGGTYRREDYLGANHAHNLYLNTLAERGLFGFGAFAAALVAWAETLRRRRPTAGSDDLEWALWGAAASAWIVTVLAGLFNNPFHHELAMLSMLLLGGWMALNRTGRSDA